MRPVCEQEARDTVEDLGLTEHLTPRRLAVANQLRGGERLADCWTALYTATSSIPAAVFRDVLARPLGRHARSGMPSGPRLTMRDEIRCADPVRPTGPV